MVNFTIECAHLFSSCTCGQDILRVWLFFCEFSNAVCACLSDDSAIPSWAETYPNS